MSSESSLILSLFTDDVLGRILSFIADDSDRRSFRAVCKSFLRVDSLHRTHLRILRLEFIQSLLFKFPRVDSLDLSVCPRIDDGTIAMLLSNGSGWAVRVRRLVLSRCAGLRFSGLEMLARSCPLLESVDVSYCCNFGDREAAALSYAARLRDLRLDKCLGVTDVGLAKVAVGCSSLEKLSLKWCFEITDLGIDLLAKKCPHLKLLDISYSKVSLLLHRYTMHFTHKYIHTHARPHTRVCIIYMMILKSVWFRSRASRCDPLVVCKSWRFWLW